MSQNSDPRGYARMATVSAENVWGGIKSILHVLITLPSQPIFYHLPSQAAKIYMKPVFFTHIPFCSISCCSNHSASHWLDYDSKI